MGQKYSILKILQALSLNQKRVFLEQPTQHQVIESPKDLDVMT